MFIIYNNISIIYIIEICENTIKKNIFTTLLYLFIYNNIKTFLLKNI